MEPGHPPAPPPPAATVASPPRLAAGDWAALEAGLLQRARLLEHIRADAYGPRELLRRGLLPTALVLGHPGYIGTLHGLQPAHGPGLQHLAFDLVRERDGLWWLQDQHTQAPAGLGRLLDQHQVPAWRPTGPGPHPLEAACHAFRAHLQHLAGAATGLALLTPDSARHGEHARLAACLGLTLVDHRQLQVRGQSLYRQTPAGPQRVPGLLNGLDEAALDPLELPAHGAAGVPGLLQALRAGQLHLANWPGSAFLGSPALLGFMPALAQDLLGQRLALPALPTWWCGEDAALQDALAATGPRVIRPSHDAAPGGAATVRTQDLGPAQWQDWLARLQREGGLHTVQAERPGAERWRFFVLCDGPGSWRVLPAGLALGTATGTAAAAPASDQNRSGD